MAERNAPGAGGRWFVTTEPHGFGHGWISGTIAAVLGLAALGTVSCMLLPDRLTTAELRAYYPLPVVRAALYGALALGFGLGAVSLVLRRTKTLGIVAVGSSAVAAALLPAVPAQPTVGDASLALGLDFFVLNLLVYSAVFLPLERLWPQRREQPTFRAEWWTDLAWFVSSALLVQVTAFLVLRPAEALGLLALPGLQQTVRSLPIVVQFVAIVAVADFVQYWVHRACHRVPLLWRFHAVHHSAVTMDWLAGSRLHVVDAVMTRALVYVPVFLLGFAPTAVGAYLVFVAAQATFVHANLRWRWLERWFVTPRFHHWHHAEAPPDVNFAVHLPIYDRLFGTWHLPGDAWPERYGLAGGVAGPRGFWRQIVAPFGRAPISGSRS